MKRTALALVASLGVLTTAGVSLAQNPDQPAPGIDVLAAAIASHQWAVVAGIGIWLVVALAKQGWLSTWLASKIPGAYQPLVALALAQLLFVAQQLASGKPVVPAVLQALEAAAMAVFTHQVVVEGVRKGKELVPATKSVQAVRDTIPPPKPDTA